MMDRDKIKVAVKKVLNAGKMNVMLLPCAEVIALLDALDSAEKNLIISEDNAGELQQCFDELMPENTRLRKALEDSDSYENGNFANALIGLSYNLPTMTGIKTAVWQIWLKEKAQQITRTLKGSE